MSYILEALKKAEHQRAIGKVPGIGSEHEAATAAGPGRWVWLLLGVLLINAALLAFALWPRSPAPVTRQAPAPLRVAPAAPGPAVAAPDDSASTSEARPQQPVQSAPEPPAVAVAPGALPHTGLRPLPPPSEPMPPEGMEQPAASVPARSTPVVAPEPIKVLPKRPAPSPAAGPYNNLPIWPQISSQLLSELNSGLHLDVHVYSENPQQRFVLINMRKYKEGEELQEGPLVDAITPDSVILSFRGQRFRMQAQ